MIDTGPLGHRDRLHFEMPKAVLKKVKAKACAAKSQFAILSRSGACRLDRSSGSGFDSPRVQIEPRVWNVSVEVAAQPAANYLDGFQNFFHS